MKPSNNSFAKIFDSVAQQYDSFSNAYTVKRRIHFFTHNAKGKCLEVGAATGRVSIALAKKHSVVATDISPKMVAQIKKNKIKAVVCDAEKLPFKDSYFDTVVGSEMIYYLAKPQKFIKEAYRVLKPNGRLLLSSANENTKIYDHIRALLRAVGFKSMYFDDKNRSFMTSTKLRELLESGNFTIVKINKTVIFPFTSFDFLNRILEKSFLSTFGVFIFVYAKKK